MADQKKTQGKDESASSTTLKKQESTGCDKKTEGAISQSEGYSLDTLMAVLD